MVDAEDEKSFASIWRVGSTPTSAPFEKLLDAKVDILKGFL